MCFSRSRIRASGSHRSITKRSSGNSARSKTLSRTASRHGLGLPLCRNLAMLLGGKIWLESDLGRFDVFRADPAGIRGRGGQHGRYRSAASAGISSRRRFCFSKIIRRPRTGIESFLRNSEFQPILALNVAQAEVWTVAALASRSGRGYIYRRRSVVGISCPATGETAAASRDCYERSDESATAMRAGR